MKNVNIFSNKPYVSGKTLSIGDTLNLQHFNAMTEANPATSSWDRCGDPNLGAAFRKNVLHKVIRCGGEPIDFNFMEELFPSFSEPRAVVGSKSWYNHYTTDPNYSIFFEGVVNGDDEATARIARAHYTSAGVTSPLQVGFNVMDIENSRVYLVSEIDTTTPYNHRVTLVDFQRAATNIKANKKYVILPARIVGGCHCPVVTNTMNEIGYTQIVRPISVTRDWRICIDTLTGFEDMPQFAVIYDMQGNPIDSFDVQQAQNARIGLRMTLNLLAFNGTPVTNEALINQSGSQIGTDGNHTGFYGFIPSLKYAGGQRYRYKSTGFSLDVDGDAILLYQDSLKRTKNFLVLHGIQFALGITDRTNMVVQDTTPFSDWEAYRRYSEYHGYADTSTAVKKLGVKSYQYKGLDLDFKQVDSFSDYRFAGNDYTSGLAIFVPKGGVRKNGREISPVEFNTYGNGQWTGNYEEHFRDYRKIDGCNDLGGSVKESMAMTVHCPGQFIIAEPEKITL